ncbi:ABC transporter permease [Staphylococcus agnetis]|uniref:ABC transporter permease n=1 Tax=Staphylococcus agnetis TaxID=985762 RepID=UPI0004E3FDC5|nr:ABC transporter permease [Staphylococcus agnetis]KFE41063.1 hypothetical protein SAGN_09722 [Staphylococcus agnetis]NJH65182.1 ABC transporter permease [Staphylococcus agnetis]NJH98636.1 ABC transporter permease [Staphylococcus agnetis]PTH46980.1 ABC transporter permease [Staphylococcus agnetis]PTH71423.1 ABC transporter permease [Staphylococcus agnetis]
MIKLETLSWMRSKKIIIILAIFIFSGFTSPIITYYSNDIINNFSNNATKVILQNPNWVDLITSYFKNVSQLVIFICAYIVADSCRLGKDKSLQLYYKTRAKNSGKILFPKILVSLIISLIAGMIGAIIALYVTWVFFDDFKLNYIVESFIVQLIGIIIFLTVAATISFWINSPFISALIVEVIIFSAIFFGSIEKFHKWSPTSMLRPNNILENGINGNDVWLQMFFGFIICIILLVLSFYKPLRRKTKS